MYDLRTIKDDETKQKRGHTLVYAYTGREDHALPILVDPDFFFVETKRKKKEQKKTNWRGGKKRNDKNSFKKTKKFRPSFSIKNAHASKIDSQSPPFLSFIFFIVVPLALTRGSL